MRGVESVLDYPLHLDLLREAAVEAMRRSFLLFCLAIAPINATTRPIPNNLVETGGVFLTAIAGSMQ
jgi:hypothetical protein